MSAEDEDCFPSEPSTRIVHVCPVGVVFQRLPSRNPYLWEEGISSASPGLLEDTSSDSLRKMVSPKHRTTTLHVTHGLEPSLALSLSGWPPAHTL